MTKALKVIVFFTTNNLTTVFFSRTNSQRPRCVYQPKPKSNMGKTDAIHVLLQATCLVLISRPHLVETKRTFQTKETVILVSMDGLGWQFISGQFADTPHLDEVGREGVRARHLFNVVPTKTWPNHHSYWRDFTQRATGLSQISSGILFIKKNLFTIMIVQTATRSSTMLPNQSGWHYKSRVGVAGFPSGRVAAAIQKNPFSTRSPFAKSEIP